MRVPSLPFLIFLTLLPLAACNRLTETSTSDASSSLGLSQRAMSESSEGTDDRMIVRSASLTVEVADVETAQDRIKDRLAEFGGYVAYVHTEVKESTTVTYRVDSKRMDEFVGEAKQLGKVTREYTSSQDVTETFIDNEARLKNLYALRDRIRLLLEKADEVEELLKIERELSRIQSEIDSLEGRQKSLQQSVDFAEVSVTFEPRRILGPLGYVVAGVGWVVEKLFIIRH